MREAETSNSLLLVPNLKFHTEIIDSESNNRSIEGLEVKGNFASYLEVNSKFSQILWILISIRLIRLWFVLILGTRN